MLKGKIINKSSEDYSCEIYIAETQDEKYKGLKGTFDLGMSLSNTFEKEMFVTMKGCFKTLILLLVENGIIVEKQTLYPDTNPKKIIRVKPNAIAVELPCEEDEKFNVGDVIEIKENN